MTAHRNTLSKTVVAAFGATLAVGSLAACGSAEKPQNIAAIDVTPEEVESVTFTAQGKSATLKAIDGLWTPAAGATVQAATMLSAEAERYFPLNSYRIMEGLNQSDPQYGLVGQSTPTEECRPLCAISVTSNAGKTWKLTVGKETFNGGFYSKIEGDPRVFLITKETVAGIISEAVGKDFAFPASDQIRKVEANLRGENADGSKKADAPDYDPYLRQVLAAEAAAECEKKNEGDCEAILADTASSTQDQPGAKDGNEVQANSDALSPTGGTTQ